MKELNIIRCENGHFYDSERYKSCPHCEVKTLIADSQRECEEWVLCYGNFPVHYVTITGNKVSYKNLIHGSRDGGLHYPDHFFDVREVVLNDSQKQFLDSILAVLSIRLASEKDEIVYAGQPPKDSYQFVDLKGQHFDILNYEKLVEFCEEVCDFMPYYN